MGLTKKAGIYKFTNLINGKVYIGQAQNIYSRYYCHACLKSSTLFGRALKKYGLNGFFFEVLELVDDLAQLDEREQYWMDVYQCYQRQYGYNVCPVAGTCRGAKYPGWAGARTGEKNPMFGRKHSPETRAKLVAARAERKISAAQIAVHAPLLRALSEARRKPIVQYDLVTGETVQLWKHLQEIHEVLGIGVTPVARMCRNKPTKQPNGKYYPVKSVKGYGWRFA